MGGVEDLLKPIVGLPGMLAEHLRGWLVLVTREDVPGATNWLKDVELVHKEFR